MNPQGIQQRDSLRPEGEIGALNQIEIIGEEEVWKDIETLEIITMKEEINVVGVKTENIAQTEVKGEIHHIADMEGETMA